MLLIPAIDLKNGQCVRLRQGRMEESTVFSTDPLTVARRWVAAGARRLHLVDLDGAFRGQPVNAGIVAGIVSAFPEVPVQVGGGIRDRETIATYLNLGVSYVIIGTRAVQAPEWVAEMCALFPGRVIVGLDARDGYVAVEGWSQSSEYEVVSFAARFQRSGVAAIVYTDIGRDGMMEGVNVDATARLARALELPVIASGGVAGLGDIQALWGVREAGIEGVILGRALYEGAIDLGEAQAWLEHAG
jgi:phosphoribosylformimino-5-aminoimidazole carboxamide ribotide isomerase